MMRGIFLLEISNFNHQASRKFQEEKFQNKSPELCREQSGWNLNLS